MHTKNNILCYNYPYTLKIFYDLINSYILDYKEDTRLIQINNKLNLLNKHIIEWCEANPSLWCVNNNNYNNTNNTNSNNNSNNTNNNINKSRINTVIKAPVSLLYRFYHAKKNNKNKKKLYLL